MTWLLCSGNNAGWNTHNTVNGRLFLLYHWFTLKDGMKIMTIMVANATLLILQRSVANFLNYLFIILFMILKHNKYFEMGNSEISLASGRFRHQYVLCKPVF